MIQNSEMEQNIFGQKLSQINLLKQGFKQKDFKIKFYKFLEGKKKMRVSRNFTSFLWFLRG